MYLEITNGEILDFILSNGNLQDRSVKITKKFRQLASLFIKKHDLAASLSSIQVTLRAIYDVKSKDEGWRNTARMFEKENVEPKPKLGRPVGRVVSLLDSPCERVERNILKDNLAIVATAAAEHGKTKEEMLKKMVEEAIRSREWDMTTFFDSFHLSPEIPIHELTALFHIANLSQRQYQLCRNLLTKYGIKSFAPRNNIDAYKKTLFPDVRIENLSASVVPEDLFYSTLSDIIDCESLHEKIAGFSDDAVIKFQVKAGLDGSGSHKKRHQLSGDNEDDSLLGSSDNFLGVFMTPMSISVTSETGPVVLWRNPTPNSIFLTRPIHIFKAKESRGFTESIFPELQASLDDLAYPRKVNGFSKQVDIDTKFTMIDRKMLDILQGDSGAFCHYCDIKRADASNFQLISASGAGGMPITKTIEECYERWELVESGEISQNNPLRAGQCHKPLLTQSGCLFAILHQALRSLDFVLKILYHLVAGHKVWSEADPTVKADVATSKAKVISHIKATCGGLLVDSPTAVGGNTNTGPVSQRFFAWCNREAICSLIDDAADRENFNILLGQFNVSLSVAESVDVTKVVDVEKIKLHCHETMIHITLHFPWVKITPSVHQMLAHNWELFEMQNGGPIAIWSESALESWNKHLRNFRSGAGCRARQMSVRCNIQDVFVRMLVTSAPVIASVRRNLLVKRQQSSCPSVVPNQEEVIIKGMYL